MTLSNPMHIQRLHYDTAVDGALAQQLARQLQLSLSPEPADPPCLVLTPQRLELWPGEGMGAIHCDFVGGAVGHRHRFGGGRGQPIAKAVGLKQGANPSVIDATAGLGRDAFVLASLGCPVRMLERNPMIAALLADGLARAASDPTLQDWIGARLRLIEGDTLQRLQAESQREPVEVIYLDPMYPHRDKSALVKKEMRIFRQLVGDDLDAPALLELALQCASKRVVVKRPKGAEPLAGPRPSAAIESKQTRFDLYVIAALR